MRNHLSSSWLIGQVEAVQTAASFNYPVEFNLEILQACAWSTFEEWTIQASISYQWPHWWHRKSLLWSWLQGSATCVCWFPRRLASPMVQWPSKIYPKKREQRRKLPSLVLMVVTKGHVQQELDRSQNHLFEPPSQSSRENRARPSCLINLSKYVECCV